MNAPALVMRRDHGGLASPCGARRSLDLAFVVQPGGAKFVPDSVQIAAIWLVVITAVHPKRAKLVLPGTTIAIRERLECCRHIDGWLGQHGSSLFAQNISALQQLDQLARPGFGIGLFAAVLISDSLGQRGRNSRAIDWHLGVSSTRSRPSAALQFMSHKRDMKSLSSEKFLVFQATAKSYYADCQVPTCGRSVGAAGAVRGRSFDASPWPGDQPGIVAPALVYACRLTPAHWNAKSLRSLCWHRNGSGGQVPNGTDLELCWNFQLSQIIDFSDWFQRFQISAPRDVRAPVRMCTCAYMREEIVGTLELYTFIYVYQLVSGSTEVPNWFQLGTGQMRDRSALRGSGNRNILGGEYSASGKERCWQRSLGALWWQRGAKVLAISAVGGADRLRLRRLHGVWLSGWICAVLSAQSERDGTAATECSSQGVDPAEFHVDVHLIVNQERRRLDRAGNAWWGVDRRRAATPASPRPAQISRAPWRCQFFGNGLSFARSSGPQVRLAEKGSGVWLGGRLRMQQRVRVVVSSSAVQRKSLSLPGVQRGFCHVK